MKTFLADTIYFTLLVVLAGCAISTRNNAPASGVLSAEPSPFHKEEFATSTALPSPDVETVVIGSAAPEPTQFEANVPATLLPTITLRQLTTGGCCVNPFWSADSKHIFFLDHPTSQSRAGIWNVDLDGSEPVFVTDKLGIYSNDQTMLAFPLHGQTFIERLTDGQIWAIANNGRVLIFSKDDTQVAWTSGRTQPPFDNAQRQVWISNVDGSNARRVVTALSAGISGWFPDGRLLINGRLESPTLGQALWVAAPPENGSDDWSLTELARAERLRGATLSPDGKWLVYVSAFSGDPAIDGLWLVNTETLEKRKLDVFGGYHWRNSTQLLIVPLEMEMNVQRIMQVDAHDGSIIQLTDPENTPLKIANGDWSVSPDGQWIVFVSAWDENIWSIYLGRN